MKRFCFGVLAVTLVAACATDTAIAPTTEIERITIWPDAKPVESLRERLARMRLRMQESIRRDETLPADVLARWEKMEGMDATLRQMELAGYTEEVVGPGESIMTLTTSKSRDAAAASSRCGNPQLAEIFMDIEASFVAGSDEPGEGWFIGSTSQSIWPGNEGWHNHSGYYVFNTVRQAHLFDNVGCKPAASTNVGSSFSSSKGGSTCGRVDGSYSARNSYASYKGPWSDTDSDCVTIAPAGGGAGDGAGAGNEQPCDTNQWAPNGDCCDIFYMSRGREICVVLP